MDVINVCLTLPLSHCLVGRPPRYQEPYIYYTQLNTSQRTYIPFVSLLHTPLLTTLVFFFWIGCNLLRHSLEVCWPSVAHLIIFVRDAPGSFSNYRKCHAIDIFHITITNTPRLFCSIASRYQILYTTVRSPTSPYYLYPFRFRI